MNQSQHRANGSAMSLQNGLHAVSGERQELETLLTVQEVAGILKVSSGWVRDHAGRKQPHLRCVRVGDLLRFRPKDLQEFIEQWCR